MCRIVFGRSTLSVRLARSVSPVTLGMTLEYTSPVSRLTSERTVVLGALSLRTPRPVGSRDDRPCWCLLRGLPP